MRRRTKSLEEHLASLRYNIRDATEALRAAVSMQRWDNVIKYAKQLQTLERKLFAAETARPRKERLAEVMGRENERRYNTESEVERRRRLSSRGWSFGSLPSRDPSKSGRTRGLAVPGFREPALARSSEKWSKAWLIARIVKFPGFHKGTSARKELQRLEVAELRWMLADLEHQYK